jgi:oligopeptide/dipeptide ABC transporter ATP-binding protein
MGVVAEMADNVMVMYCGRALEYADVRTLFKEPKHPYTIGLLNSIPRIKGGRKKLYAIKGSVPVPGEITAGCRFNSRCEYVFEKCLVEEPPIFEVGKSKVRCWKYEGKGVTV